MLTKESRYSASRHRYIPFFLKEDHHLVLVNPGILLPVFEEACLRHLVDPLGPASLHAQMRSINRSPHLQPVLPPVQRTSVFRCHCQRLPMALQEGDGLVLRNCVCRRRHNGRMRTLWYTALANILYRNANNLNITGLGYYDSIKMVHIDLRSILYNSGGGEDKGASRQATLAYFKRVVDFTQNQTRKYGTYGWWNQPASLAGRCQSSASPASSGSASRRCPAPESSYNISPSLTHF